MKQLAERLKRVVEESKLTPNSFANQAGIAPSNFRKMLIGEQNITDRTLGLISDKYGVSYEWLKTGDGNMMINSESLSDEQINGIPFYDSENFECGTQAGFGGALESSKPDGYFNFPWVKNDGSVFCVRAHGNSMVNYHDPIHSISHGSYIALRKSNVRAIQWGEVYALATADGYIVKKIMPSEQDGCVQCVSFNEDYPAYDLPTSEIYDYAIVVGVATINIW